MTERLSEPAPPQTVSLPTEPSAEIARVRSLMFDSFVATPRMIGVTCLPPLCASRLSAAPFKRTLAVEPCLRKSDAAAIPRAVSAWNKA